jgi:hypothetical protein
VTTRAERTGELQQCMCNEGCDDAYCTCTNCEGNALGGTVCCVQRANRTALRATRAAMRLTGPSSQAPSTHRTHLLLVARTAVFILYSLGSVCEPIGFGVVCPITATASLSNTRGKTIALNMWDYERDLQAVSTATPQPPVAPGGRLRAKMVGGRAVGSCTRGPPSWWLQGTIVLA